MVLPIRAKVGVFLGARWRGGLAQSRRWVAAAVRLQRWRPIYSVLVVVGTILGLIASGLALYEWILPVREPTLARLARADYRKSASALPAEEKNRVILGAVDMLKRPLNLSNLEHNAAIIDFLDAVTTNNGHVLYYKGEIARWQRPPGDSHAPFFLYLELEKTLPESERSGGPLGDVCYKRVEGFCPQRTAWICRQLAVDFFERGRDAAVAAAKRRNFCYAARYLKCVYDRRDKGFTQPPATADMLRHVQAALKVLEDCTNAK